MRHGLFTAAASIVRQRRPSELTAGFASATNVSTRSPTTCQASRRRREPPRTVGLQLRAVTQKITGRPGPSTACGDAEHSKVGASNSGADSRVALRYETDLTIAGPARKATGSVRESRSTEVLVAPRRGCRPARRAEAGRARKYPRLSFCPDLLASLPPLLA